MASPKKSPAPKKARKAAPPVEVDAAPVETPAVEVDAAPAEAPAVVEPSADAIRARAFALWQAEGGGALDNWLRAEAELRAQA